MNRIFYISMFLFAVCAFGNEWMSYHTGNSPLPSDSVYAITKGIDGSLWFGTERGLVCLQNQSWKVFPDDSGLVDEPITTLVCEKRDPFRLFLGTMLGINMVSIVCGEYHIDGLFNAANSGLPSEKITATSIDENNLKLFGTTRGVAVFDGQKWQTLDRTNALNRDHILSLYAHRDGWKYIGTKEGGVERIKFDNVDLDGLTGASIIDRNWSGLLSDNVLSILIDSQERQWFGTDRGLCMHVGDETQENWTCFTRDDGLASDSVLVIAEDLGGGMWIGTSAGVSRLSGERITTHTSHDGLLGDTIFDIELDDSGTVWLATNNGIAKKAAVSSVVEKSHPRSPGIELKVSPNPFQEELAIHIVSPVTRSGKLLVFNIQGQLIKQIDLDILKGDQHVLWDGRDSRQRLLPRGMYFVCLVAGQRIVAKVTRL